ncbi:unnamed protein product [Protopolystoma xenopodis]|uniref:Uncharacterized protein n=1 Tax=Protopolystoma xenopodis TaxID=117903 RepID=A0A448XSY6_9PLAT|nr:unnamed protein product [Protopolystoma xenopodis]
MVPIFGPVSILTELFEFYLVFYTFSRLSNGHINTLTAVQVSTCPRGGNGPSGVVCRLYRPVVWPSQSVRPHSICLSKCLQAPGRADPPF